MVSEMKGVITMIFGSSKHGAQVINSRGNGLIIELLLLRRTQSHLQIPTRSFSTAPSTQQKNCSAQRNIKASQYHPRLPNTLLVETPAEPSVFLEAARCESPH